MQRGERWRAHADEDTGAGDGGELVAEGVARVELDDVDGRELAEQGEERGLIDDPPVGALPLERDALRSGRQSTQARHLHVPERG